MPLTFYWFEPSSPVRTVNLLIHALDLTVEYKAVDLFTYEHLKPDFVKMCPLHIVPVIDDNGFVLWESRAIITYLASKYGKDDSLYPKDLQKRAIVDQRLHYSNDAFYPVRELTQGVYFHKRLPTPELLQKIREAQENIEKLLTGNKFIAGDSLTVADYSFVTIVDLMELYYASEDKFPLTKEWFERCKLVMKDFDKANQKGADALIAKLKSFIDKK